MPAELALDRCFGDRANFQRKCRIGEFLHHLLGLEEPEITTIRTGRTNGLILRSLGKISAGFQFRNHCFRLIFVIKQDMAGLDLVIHRGLFQIGLVGGFDFRVSRTFLDDPLNLGTCNKLLLDCGHLLFHFIAFLKAASIAGP